MTPSHDAVILRNSSLAQAIRGHRSRQLELLMDMRRELGCVSDVVDGVTKYGRAGSTRSIRLDRRSHPYLEWLASRFEQCLFDYRLQDIEIWLGDSRPVPYHNDASFYLRAGREVLLQFWVLLEACVTREPPIDATKNKNALQCVLPIAPGVLFPGMDRVLTPQGFADLPRGPIVGGDDLTMGDVLMFKNGVVHFKPSGDDSVFRAALAFRGVRKDAPEAPDDRNEHLIWFRNVLRQLPDLHVRLSANPYFVRFADSLASLPERDADIGGVTKVDCNDYPRLMQRLETYDFTQTHRS